MASDFNIFAWRIPWTEEPDGLQSVECKELDTTEVTEHAHIYPYPHSGGCMYK